MRAVEHRRGGHAHGRRIEPQEARGGAVDHRHGVRGVDRHDARRDPFENRLDIAAAALDLDVLALELEGRAFDFPPGGRQLAGHGVERFGQGAELVVALRLDPLIQMPRADLARGGRQHEHGPGDPLRQVRAHPDRAEQDEQGDHQEERQIEAGQRAPQHAQLVVAFERLRHAAGAFGHLAGQVVGGDDDPLRAGDRDRG